LSPSGERATIVLSDLGSSAYYVGAISEQAIGKGGAVVHPGNHAFLIRGASSLHRELQHVRARWSLPSGMQSDGQHGGKVFSLSANV